MTLVAGSYERFLFGFEYSVHEDRTSLSRSFTHAAHKGPVKCIDSCGPFVASGGSDDTIHIYDLKVDKDLGFLMNPCNGAVTCLRFFRPADKLSHPSHLFTGSAEGGITVWKVGSDWSSLKTMQGHTSSVNGIAVHSSGLVALSVSRDMHLRMWNLKRGKCTYHSKLEVEAEDVQFNQTGQLYNLVCGPLVSVHSVDDAAGRVAALQHERKVLASCWQGPHAIITGGEDTCLRLFDTRTGTTPQLSVPQAHSTRIKGVALLEDPQQQAASGQLLGSCSSDGVVRVWDLRNAQSNGSSSSALCEASTGARFTCLTSWTAHRAEPKTQQEPAMHVKPKKSQQEAPKDAAKSEEKHRNKQGKMVDNGGEAQRKVKKKQKQRLNGGTADGETTASAKETGKQNHAKISGKRTKHQTHGAKDIVKDGVVEFLDDGDAKKKKKKSKQLK